MDVHRDQSLGGLGEAPAQEGGQSRMQTLRRRTGCCVRVAPWVSAVSCIMIGLGLGIWYVYTARAMDATSAMAAQLFRQPVYLVQQMAAALGWVRLVGVIVVSCMLGLTMMLALLRTYQRSATLPTTSCGAPGKLSYGSYAGLIALLNFGWWLITLAVSLLLATSLVWLTAAFMLNSGLTKGVTLAATGASSAADLTASQKVLKGLAAAAVPVVACPATCLNLGSFHDVLRLPSSCACSETSMADVAGTAEYLWKTLVHVLAALALMGLGCLWLLMNLSANFAHARRDWASPPGHADSIMLGGDGIAAVTLAPYVGSKKGASAAARRDQDAARAADNARTGLEFTGVEALPECVIEPAALPEPNAYEAFQETPVGGAAAFMAGAVAGDPSAPVGPSPRSTEAEQPSPGGSRGATFNSTAQRYAAYRLRAAQAAAAKGSPASEGRKQWMR